MLRSSSSVLMLGAALLATSSTAMAAGGGGEVTDKNQVFPSLYSHLEPHALFPMGPFTFYDIHVVQLIAVLVMFFVFSKVRKAHEASVSGGSVASMGRVARIGSGFVMFIRDEMCRPLLGDEDTKQYLGFFLFTFFFIALMNLLGLVPHSRTATASICVTGALALIIFVQMIRGGIQTQGVAGFFKGLIPHGLPSALVPLLFVVEIIGLLVKPFALMIRLFANLLAGHLVVYSFLGLIFYFAFDLGNAAYAVAVPAGGLMVFMMIIEGFVALLQAYIFTYLSILFVGMCRHPDH